MHFLAHKYTIGALLAAATGGSLMMSVMSATTPAQAQITVFDPSNYAQNILTAARTLQSVNQQIQQLQNEAQMLVNQGKNLARIDFPQIDALKQKLAEINRLMGRAQAIDFRVDQVDDQFKSLFPQDSSWARRTDARIRDARARLDASMGAFRETMTVQAQIVENIQSDTEALADIVARSQGAEGSLAAQQATNQLLALTAKQQFQLQHMMAAQFRSEAIERARLATQAAEARVATKKFLGSGSAYTPE
jgi:P-type conjugative transfer protein TrbJ